MNVPESMLKQMGYDRMFDTTKRFMEMHFGGPCELLLSTDTLQYSDYDKFESKLFDKEAKYKRHAEVFPKDCGYAFALGARMAS
jgi:hypothetical protein